MEEYTLGTTGKQIAEENTVIWKTGSVKRLNKCILSEFLYFTCLVGTKYYDLNGVYMRSGTYGRYEKCVQNFTWEIQREKTISSEDVQFPVSVPSDIEVVRWGWGRSKRINKCVGLAE